MTSDVAVRDKRWAERVTERLRLQSTIFADSRNKIIELLHEAQDGEDFFEKLDTGAGMEVGHPILALRKQLKLIHDDPTQGYNPRRIGGLVLKAWNKYRDGDTDVKLLKFTVGGAHPDRLPEAR